MPEEQKNSGDGPTTRRARMAAAYQNSESKGEMDDWIKQRGPAVFGVITVLLLAYFVYNTWFGR